MRRKTFWILISLVAAVCSSVAEAGAQGGATPGQRATPAQRWESRHSKSVIESWSRQLQRIDQMIRDDNNKKALNNANRLASEMVNRIKSGDGGRLLGTLNVLRALAAFNTGDLKADGEFTVVCASLEALWQWSFEPAKLNGQPVEVWYNLTINFR